MPITQIQTALLDNGLFVIGQVNPAAKSAGVGYFVKTGSRDELLPTAGVSHFLEHMVFKGTPTRSALEITRELGNMGAQANAYTTEESTVFYGAVLPEFVRPFLTLLSDMMQPAIEEGEFETERKVILEEIALYQDRPTFYLFERALRDYYGTHPIGNSVLGTTESVGVMPHSGMVEYHSRRYRPGNMVLVASGNFSWERFLDDAVSLTSNWKQGPCDRAPHEHVAKPGLMNLTRPNLQQAHLLMLTNGPSAQTEARYPLSLLATILGDSSGSHLYWELVDKGIAEGASLEVDERDGIGCVFAAASCEPKRIEEVSGVIRDIVSRPMEFTEEDLERAKQKVATRIVMGGELPMGRLMALGTEWLYRQETTELRTIIDRLRRVTREEVAEALVHYPLQPLKEYRLLPE